VALNIGELLLLLNADPTKLEQALKQAQSQTKTTTKNIAQNFEKVGKEMRDIGLMMSAAITTPLALIGKKALEMAMDTVESENLFEVSMGNMADAARQWSQELRDSLGLNEYEVRKNVGTFNVMLSSMGLGEQQAYDMAKSLTQLAYDMASFYNLQPWEAFEKLQAGISGEVEPLKRLGIVVNDTTVQHWALTNGLIKQGDQLTEQQKILARYNVIMEATQKAQGDMARTIESPANQLRVLKEQFNMLLVDLGKQMIPTFLNVVGVLKNVVTWFSNLSDEQKKLVVTFGAVTAGIPPILSGLGQMIITISKLRTAMLALNASSVLTFAGYASVAAVLLGLSKGLSNVTNSFVNAAHGTKSWSQTLTELIQVITLYPPYYGKLIQNLFSFSKATQESTKATQESSTGLEVATKKIEEYRQSLESEGYTKEKATELTSQFAESLGYVTDKAGNLVPPMNNAKESVENMGDAAQDAASNTDKLRQAFDNLIKQIFDNVNANDEMNRAETEYKEALNEVVKIEKEITNVKGAKVKKVVENDEALNRYLQTNSEYNELLEKQRDLQGQLNEYIAQGDTANAGYFAVQNQLAETEKRLNEIRTEGIKLTGDTVVVGLSDAQSKQRLAELNAQLAEATAKADSSAQDYLSSLYQVYTAEQTSTDMKEQARLKAIELGLEYLNLGKISADGFVKMANQFGFSSGQIALQANLTRDQIQQALTAAAKNGIDSFMQLADDFGIRTWAITTYAQNAGINIETELRKAANQGISSFIDLASQFGFSAAEMMAKASEMGIHFQTQTEGMSTDMYILKMKMLDVHNTPVEPKIKVDTSDAEKGINNVKSWLESLKDKVIHIWTKVMSREGGLFMSQGGLLAQSGKYVTGAGEVPAVLHPPEVVLNSRQALRLVWNLANTPLGRAKPVTTSGPNIVQNVNITTTAQLTESEIRRQLDLISRQLVSRVGL